MNACGAGRPGGAAKARRQARADLEVDTIEWKRRFKRACPHSTNQQVASQARQAAHHTGHFSSFEERQQLMLQQLSHIPHAQRSNAD